MTVRSKDLVDGKVVEGKGEPRERVQTLSTPRVAAGVLLLAFGLPLWLGGARYTFDGWPIGINLFLAWIGIPLALPIPPIPPDYWYIRLIGMIVLGYLYSRVETRPPRDRFTRKRAAVVIMLWFAVALAITTDVGSTFIGVRNPAPAAWPLTRWIAGEIRAASVWSVFLTFVPDWMIIIGWRLLFRR